MYRHALSEEETFRNRVRLGIVISYNAHNYPYIQVDVVQGEPNEGHTAFAGKIEKLDVARFVSTDVLEEDDRLVLQQVRKILSSEVNRYLNRNSPFSGIWENIVQQHDDELPEETRQLIIEYLHPKYKKLFTDVADSNFTFFLPRNKALQTANLLPANCSINFITPEINVHFTGTHYEITCTARTPLGNKNVAENVLSSSLLFQQEDQFYLWQKPEDVLLVEKFLPSGKIIADLLEWNNTLQHFILPLTKDIQCQFQQHPERRDTRCKARGESVPERKRRLPVIPAGIYLSWLRCKAYR